MNCPKCGRFTKEREDKLHRECSNCDLYWCFEKGCHCTEGLTEEEKSVNDKRIMSKEVKE